MLKEKLRPELCVAIVLSAMILVITGTISYVSKNNIFIFVGFATILFSMPVVLVSDKL